MFAVVAAPVDENLVAPGLLGFLVVLALGIALVLLVRSMQKQISRIQAPKEEELKQLEWERRQAERAKQAGPGRPEADPK